MKAIFNLAWRLSLFLLHIISGLVQELVYYSLYGKNWHTHAAGKRAIQRWMRQLGFLLGLKITVSGIPSCFHKTMIVANHISWLDIIALLSIRDVVFMAKAEVRKWPVIGLLAAACGTLFIERGNKTALKQAIDSLVVPLRQGSTVAIFPEGTTTDGSTVLPFYSGLFSAAITTESYIQPVAISYIRLGQPDTIAPYTEKDTFVSHILKIMSQGSTHIYLDFLPKLRTQTYSRLELAKITREKIIQSLHGSSPYAETVLTVPLAKTA